MKSKPKTVRLEGNLETAVETWLQANPTVDFSWLANMAIRNFISTPQAIELQPVSMDDAMREVTHVMRNHRKAIDNLK